MLYVTVVNINVMDNIAAINHLYIIIRLSIKESLYLKHQNRVIESIITFLIRLNKKEM